MNRWHDNLDSFSPILKFFKEVRIAFYTTNAIELLNSCYRRLNKQRSVFPSSQALMKTLYLGTFEIAQKWTIPMSRVNIRPNFSGCSQHITLFLLLNKQRLNHRKLLLSRINYHRISKFTEKFSHPPLPSLKSYYEGSRHFPSRL